VNKLATALQYAQDIQAGRIVANRYVRLAMERHFRDMADSEAGGEFYFCEKAGQKALRFFDFLTLSKGVSRDTVPPEQVNPDGTIRFTLQPWQSFMIASLFGWRKRSDGLRRFTEAYIEVPKKNAKTTTASGIGNYMFTSDNEPGPEVYMAAYTRDQAGICFEEAVAQVKASHALSSRVSRLKYSMHIARNRAKLTAVSHDADNTEGKNAHCIILDEYHVHKSDKVKDSLQSGQAARKQPLLFIITTAGYNKQGPCYKHRDLCIGMLEGKYQLDNVFSLIYGIDEGDDWKDEETWVKANPSLGVTVQMDYLRREFQKAIRSGTKEVDFKTKHLNLWVDAATTWIPSETWNKLGRPDFVPPPDALCYGGLDLASTSDITALSLFFPKYQFFQRFLYVPEEAAKIAARAGIDYSDWVRDGHLIATPGKTTNYNFLMHDIMELTARYQVQFIAYDRYNASHIVQELNDQIDARWAVDKDGKGSYQRILQPFGQGFISMSTPTKEYEKRLTDETVTHDGNPVMAWMIGNVALRRDAADNIKVDKSESKDKIDGIVADIMALGEYLTWNWNQPPHDSESVGIY
jgi:phage terminase large subunit-like protein